LVGTVLLGRVRIVRPLAHGGMGKVYVGEQTGLERPCAVKVLDPRLAAADVGDFTRRFLLEASVAAKISHPNVVTVFDYGETPNGNCFIAMEYLEGRTLADDLKSGPLGASRAAHVARQMCAALHEAHALGVVHRDVKPGNVFLMQRDEDTDFVKVLDFGLVGEAHGHDAAPASDAPPGVPAEVPIMGSPKYMAPEQVHGHPTDARTDVYAVGAVLYAMLAGRPPFERATDLATMMAQVSDAPPPLAAIVAGLPQGLEAIVLKCLEKDPDRRYRTVDELLAALKLPAAPPVTVGVTPVLAAPPIEVRTSMAPRSGVPSRSARRSAVTPVMVLGVCAAVVFGVMGASELRRRLSGGETPSQSAPVTAAATPSLEAPRPAPRDPGASLTAKLHIETVPAGAKVKEEGETLCEATPCDVVFKGTAADPKTEHLLVFLKADYKLEHKVATMATPAISVKLTHAK
jgi:serine/threonine-protein kinase